MDKEEIRGIIDASVNAAVEKLQALGMLRDNSLTAYEKTEKLLWKYPDLKAAGTPYANRVAAEIDRCLADAASDPYVEVIRLYYFQGLKNAACARAMNCGERTCRRYRVALVQQFSTRLASDDFIRELLL